MERVNCAGSNIRNRAGGLKQNEEVGLAEERRSLPKKIRQSLRSHRWVGERGLAHGNKTQPHFSGENPGAPCELPARNLVAQGGTSARPSGFPLAAGMHTGGEHPAPDCMLVRSAPTIQTRTLQGTSTRYNSSIFVSRASMRFCTSSNRLCDCNKSSARPSTRKVSKASLLIWPP